MPRSRRKISAPLQELHSELDRLIKYDAENQRLFSSSRSSAMSLLQLHMLTESIFSVAFRQYEGFLRDIFILYCQEKRPHSGRRVESYLKPKNFLHAEEMIKSSMLFVDWTSPDTIIYRAELYLKDGFPIKLPYTTNREVLTDLKRIRNHIAHNSEESLNAYKKVIRKHYTVDPLQTPRPGKFLLEPDRADPTKYKLLVYLQLLRSLSDDLTQ